MYLFLFVMFIYFVGYKALRVHGPSDPLVAQLGGSVLLSCFIESSLPLEDLQVEWRKLDSDSAVSLFRQGKSRPDLQTQVLRDRAGFFPDEVSKGNFSILLKNVVKEDAGVYRCQVNTTQDTGEVIIEIKEIKHFVVKGADQPAIAFEGEDVILNCSVDSHVQASEIEEVTWRKTDRDQDILVLLYQDSEIFPDSSHESYQGRVDLFSSEILKGNFSLHLMNIKMEDKGEFTCEVHTRNMSASTTVVLHSVGFSAHHMSILVLCSVALLLSLGFCGPVFSLLKRKDTSKKALNMHICLILCPNICMFIAFILWSKEGFLVEIVACSSVSIIRPFMLMKTSPYLSSFPTCLQNALKALAIPLYNSIIAISACSFFFDNFARVQTTAGYILIGVTLIEMVSFISAIALVVCRHWIRLIAFQEIFSAVLLGLFLSSTKDNFEYIVEVHSVILPLLVGMILVITLQRHFFQGKPFDYVSCILSSVIIAIFSLSAICVYLILSDTSKDSSGGSILIIEAVVFIYAWLGVICILCCHKGHKQETFYKWRKTGYICCIVIDAGLIITYGIYIAVRYTKIFKGEKDPDGYGTILVFVHILAVTCLFVHPKYFQDSFHIMVYMLGAVGISSLNAITLTTELILKAVNGKRTIKDLRVVVFSLETVFVSTWLVLQLYDAWKRYKYRVNRVENHFKERRPAPEEDLEMEVLQDPICN